MAPTTPTKDRQFAFILSSSEHEQLMALADAEHRTAAAWLRFMIFREYAAKFDQKPRNAGRSRTPERLRAVRRAPKS